MIYYIHDLALDIMERDKIGALILTQNNAYVELYYSEPEEEPN